MFKFITGLMAGVAIMFGYTSFTNSHTMTQTDTSEDIMNISGVWYGVHNNFKLRRKMLISGEPPISLTATEPLLAFSLNDIQSGCVIPAYKGPLPGEFRIEVYFKPEARRKIGRVLAERDGKKHSFRLFGNEGDRFVANKDAAVHFVNVADAYPTVEDIDPNIDLEKPGAFDYDADVVFTFPQSASLYAWSLAKRLLGGREKLLGCAPHIELTTAIGYNESLF
ncbi:hypothetical protein [Kordiimonas aquimaris]|uniref:hypothetical protein n=1 Tax=Kordiimonas aquimaris TaxID=707591 RepID=UPI0021D283B0|nr:hypothetical protein [Kordiimonas aquimaris]